METKLKGWINNADVKKEQVNLRQISNAYSDLLTKRTEKQYK